jgi:hypothetical protein
LKVNFWTPLIENHTSKEIWRLGGTIIFLPMLMAVYMWFSADITAEINDNAHLTDLIGSSNTKVRRHNYQMETTVD